MNKRRIRILAVLFIITLGFTVYSNTLSYEFIWDDELLILSNRGIKNLGNISNLFAKSITYSTPIESNSFRPLQMSSYALNYATAKLNVGAYHLTNIALHILVALLLYCLARLLTKNEAIALASSLLFICHPIHTEAVAYISGRSDSLAAFFMLLTLILFITYLDNKKIQLFYLASVVSFLLALLSKEIALVIPLLILTYTLIYRGKTAGYRLYLPFLLFDLTYIVLRLSVLNFSTTETVIDATTLFQRIPVIFQSFAFFWQKLIVPLELHMEYEPIIPPWADAHVIAGMIIMIVLTCAAMIWRRHKLFLFSLSWFLINWLPVSNIYPLNAFFAEHWLYTPSIGLFLLIGWVIGEIYKKGKIAQCAISIGMAALITTNASLTLKQNLYWKNAEYFYTRTLTYSPRSARVYYRLGRLYLRQGRIEQGIEQIKKSLALNPNFIPAYEALVSGYIVGNNFQLAIQEITQALIVAPYSSNLYNNLGIAYAGQKNYSQALTAFKKAVELTPQNALTYNNLGSVYANIGQNKEAIAAFSKAIEIDPQYAEGYYNLAKLYDELGEYILAEKYAQKSRELAGKSQALVTNQYKNYLTK